MKKIIILLLLCLSIVSVNAQRGRLKTLAVDTVKGNVTKAVAEIPITGTYNSLFISVQVDRISTAAGGTLYLKSGLDSTSAIVVSQVTNPTYGFAPNDTLTTADVATQYLNIAIPDPEATTYQILCDGDVNDTIKITTKYFIK